MTEEFKNQAISNIHSILVQSNELAGSFIKNIPDGTPLVAFHLAILNLMHVSIGDKETEEWKMAQKIWEMTNGRNEQPEKEG